MNITDYILKDIQTFHTGDSIADAVELTQKQIFTHAIVTDYDKFVSLIPARDLNDIEEKSKKINEFSYLTEFFYAKEDDTLLDLLNLFSRNESNILPVTDSEYNYLGYYDLNDVLNCFSDAPFFNKEGVTLIVEKTTKNFTFSEVTQIIESNDARVLGLYISNISESNTQLTVKVRTENANELIQSFRRYDYVILSNHSDDNYLEDLKNRSDYLQKYLNL